MTTARDSWLQARARQPKVRTARDHPDGCARVAIGLLLALNLGAPVMAGPEQWRLCDTPGGQAADTGLNLELDINEPIRFTAAGALLDTRGRSRLWGGVEMRQGERLLRADSLVFVQREHYAEAEGNILFEANGFELRGERARVQLDQRIADFFAAHYRYTPMHARGRAAQIHHQGSGQTRLERATYTTCDPDSAAWRLTAGEVRLDQQQGVGTAENVLVQFYHWPLLYTPWIRFPIDDRRKSGMLPPSLGNGTKTGPTLSIPLYWNIAPQRDATLTPRLLSKRGLQLQGEFRYLNRHSQGQIDTEYLNDLERDTPRHLARWRHEADFGEHWRATLLLQRVSDQNYFEDLGNSLALTSITHLERQLALAYRDRHWQLQARLQDYQTIDADIDPADQPYRRLPQLQGRFDWRHAATGVEFALASEWVRFTHDELTETIRLDTTPRVTRPWRDDGWYLTPTLAVRHTRYWLEGEDQPDRQLQRSLPIATVDTGLTLARPLDAKRRQTLEPRLYYLYIPWRDQQDLPVLDTARMSFNFEQLFRDDRFAGADRVTDANQLTVAATTRVENTATGRELFRAGAGQVLFFERPQVTLPNQPAIDRGRSNLVGELQARVFDHWSLGGDIIYDPITGRTDRTTVTLDYYRDRRHRLGLSYRFIDQDLEQTDFSWAWPLTRRWLSVGRWTHSWHEARDLEMVLGLEYEHCCWAARFVGRRFITETTGEYNTAIQFQLVLKGLGGIGSSLDNIIERDRPGS